MANIYSYKRWDGITVDLSGMLGTHSKEEVARLAGVQYRRQALIAAIESLYKASELDTIKEVLETRYNVHISQSN